MKSIDNVIKVTVSLKHQLNYVLIVFATLVVGLALKILFHETNRKNFEYNNFTGIPYLNKYHIVCPVLISTVIFVISLYDKKEKSVNLINRLRELREYNLTYYLQNLISFIVFLTLYYGIITQFYKFTKFKISGHYAVIVFSNHILVNNIEIANHLSKTRVMLFKYIKYISFFIITHNLYQLVFTCFIYHTIEEATAGFIISSVLVQLIHRLEIDRKFVEKYL